MKKINNLEHVSELGATEIGVTNQSSESSIQMTPVLVEEHSSDETEQLWKKRLKMFMIAEKNLIKSVRIRKITGIVAVASAATFFFSLYLAPTMSPALFLGLLSIAVFGVTTYPGWFFASKTNKKQRDAISRLFFISNHEVEVADGKITLINRANYTSVTELHVMDRKLGHNANS